MSPHSSTRFCVYLRLIAGFLGVAIGSPSADSLLIPIALTVDNEVSVRELVKLLIRDENWKRRRHSSLASIVERFMLIRIMLCGLRRRKADYFAFRRVLFLYGMETFSQEIQTVGGETLRRWIGGSPTFGGVPCCWVGWQQRWFNPAARRVRRSAPEP
jgi:hypothetical protein